jgi:hypothetical protein
VSGCQAFNAFHELSFRASTSVTQLFGHFLRTPSFHLSQLSGTVGRATLFFQFLMHPLNLGTGFIQLAFQMFLYFARLRQSFFQLRFVLLRNGRREGDK